MEDKNVPAMLRHAAEIYEQRNSVYKNNYKEFGKLAVDFFGPIRLKTISDFNRFAVMVHILTRISRYAQCFHSGGHDDSLDDIAVYSMILRELDLDNRANGNFQGENE
jgi:hypothetical protein